MILGRIKYTFIRNTSTCIWFNSKRSLGTSNIRLKKREKEQWTTVKEESVVPEGEWKSFFHYFAPKKGITVDMINVLQRPVDLSPNALRQWYKNLKYRHAVFTQSYLKERVQTVGCELAAAHFMVSRGGKIRFKGSEEWLVMDEDGEYNLPRFFTPGYFVEAIDASGMGILYEGLECLSNLEYLQSLNLSNCLNIDDWCIDRICGQFYSTIKYLNISNCTNITGLGITALARLRELRTLDITGLHNIKDIQLLCLLLEDTNPNIKIIGVNYMELPMLQ